MPDSQDRTNSSVAPVLSSDNSTRRHCSGEDAPENRQDLVAVHLPRSVWERIGDIVEPHAYKELAASQDPACDTLMFLDALSSALYGHGDPAPPDQGEHVAQRKEGEWWNLCENCAVYDEGDRSYPHPQCNICGVLP